VHIPDGFLGAPVAASTWVLAGAGLAGALRAERRDPVAVPAGVLGSLAAFVFAAQMVNVPIAPGTSGHLVGATLVALLVGPWRTLIVMAAVLAIQALLFQDGGITAFGANLIDMGVAGAFVGYTVATFASRLAPGPRGYAIGGVLGAFAATLTGAALTSLWLALSGLYPLGGILPVMLVSHAAIGLLEALLTGAILVTVLRWRPDLVGGLGEAAARRRPAALALGVCGLAALVAAFIAPFASRLPDGLERAALDLGFAGRLKPLVPAPLWESASPHGPLAAVAPVLAGVVGTGVAGIVAWLLTRSLAIGSNESHR
jgi:cobalt/nickel transport system permease protein